MSHVAIWKAIISAVRKQLRPDTFERWFEPCMVKSHSSNELIIQVPNVFHRNWILEHYGPFILNSLRDAAGQDAAFQIVTAGEPESPPAAKRKARTRRPSASPTPVPKRPSSNNGSKLNPRYTFENFIEGSCNRFARAASIAAAQAPGRAYNPLFIYGGVGLGKTHLMQAIGHYALSHLQGMKIHYVSSESFTNHLIRSLQTRRVESFRRSYRDVNALLIDDIAFLSGKEQTQEEFFHTFNALYDLRSQIVISCDRPPSDLPKMEERLVSRFESGLVVDLQVPDLETRVAILLKNAAHSSIVLPDAVAFFIAEKVRSNIRKLEGALVQAASYAKLMNRPLTVDLAQHALRDLLLGETNTPTPEAIQKVVAEHFDVRVADMKSRRRPKTIALPRQIAMALCRELTPLSLHEIGEAFGGRHHATVIHACKVLKNLASSDPKFRALLSRFREALCAR